MANDWNKINKLIDNIPILWINLNRAERRRKIMQCNLDKLETNIERIEGVDGKTLNMDVIKDKFIVPSNLSIYEVACALSHLKAIEKAFNNNYERVIILEDDATFEYFKYKNTDINSLFTEIENKGCECIQLAHIINRKVFKSLIKNDWKYLNRNDPGAQAYILNRNGMKNVLDSFFNNKTIGLSEHMIFRTANTFIVKPYFSYPFLRDDKGKKVNISFIRDNTKSAHATQTISKQLWDDYYKELFT